MNEEPLWDGPWSEIPRHNWPQNWRRQWYGYWHVQPEIPTSIAVFILNSTLNVQTGSIILPGEENESAN